MKLFFFIKNVVLGAGLSMDAFSISLANGLNEPKMSFPKACLIAGMFAFSQLLMPLIGWTCVHTVAEYFASFEKLIPWIALILLSYIGANMLYDSFKLHSKDTATKTSLSAVFLQSIATSIDALSVGFTISEYDFRMALMASLTIGVTTFAICLAGVFAGKRFGSLFADKAGIFGGAILIFIGLEIFISSFLRG